MFGISRLLGGVVMDTSAIVVVIVVMVLAAGAILRMEINSRRTGADKHQRNATNVDLNQE